MIFAQLISFLALRSRFQIQCLGIASCALICNPAFGQMDASGTTDNAPAAVERTTLDTFVAEETGDDFRDISILQTANPVTGIYGTPMELIDVPRAVTNITPVAMQDFGIRGLDDLQRVSANTTQANFFGISGIPYIRGRNANVYFNGMRKLYQRNESPVSVYGAESIEVVKGAPPAHLGVGRVGGYVNLIPKAPNLDEATGQVTATVGSYDFYQGQVDGSIPFANESIEGALRVSVTGQLADSYYDNVEENFIEAYASAVIQLDANNSLFTGAEYFNVQTNENPGWNRVTQELIDNGRYMGGEPVDLTSTYAGGLVGKGSVPGLAPAFLFPNPDNYPLNPAFAGPIEMDRRVGGGFAPPYPDLPDGSSPTAAPYPAGTNYGALIAPTAWIGANATPAQQALLGPNGEYTTAYIDAGGPIYTVPIEGNQVLVDPEDFTNSQDFIYFLDWVNTADPDRTFKNQIYFEYFETNRRSTYGFSVEAEQFAIENRFTMIQQTDDLFGAGEQNTFIPGFSFRYTHAKMYRDFDAEPFSRRDLTRPITNNSRVIAGAQLNSDGTNNWSQFADASVQSDLYEAGIFNTWEAEWNDWFTTITDLRAELIGYDTGQPGGTTYPWQGYIFAGGTTADASGTRGGGGAAFSPVITVADGVNLYGTVNYTTTQLFQSTNAVTGGDNFGQALLYEVGIKTELLDNTLYAGLAAYYFDEDQLQAQVAQQTRVRGQGLEFEMTYVPDNNFQLLATAGYQRVYLRSDLPFRFQYAGNRLPVVAGGNFATGGDPTEYVAQNNPDKIVPVVPQFTANIFAIYQFDNGFGAGIGPTYRASYWLNYERTLNAPHAVVWNAIAFYRQPTWDIMLEVTNLTSEDYFLGGTEFASNTVITKAPPVEFKVSVSWRW